MSDTTSTPYCLKPGDEISFIVKGIVKDVEDENDYRKGFSVPGFFVVESEMDDTVKPGPTVSILSIKRNSRPLQVGDAVVFKESLLYDPEHRPVYAVKGISDDGKHVWLFTLQPDLQGPGHYGTYSADHVELYEA